MLTLGLLLRWISAVCVLLLAGRWAIGRLTASMVTDYGAMPRAVAFERICRRPPPDGMSDIRVAGHAFLAAEVWIRCRATDAAIQSILGEENRVDKGMFRACCGPERWNEEEPRSIGFAEVATIRRPEYFEFYPTRDGSGWVGVAAVDRQRHMLYVYASPL